MPSVFDLPRYQENPIYFFFESYILDIIGKLPAGKDEALQSVELQRIFSTQASAWREVIREVLHLSGTIDIAILDLWIRNQNCYDDTTEGYQAFAQDFTDHYTADDSKVDIWPAGELEAAQERIREYQSK